MALENKANADDTVPSSSSRVIRTTGKLNPEDCPKSASPERRALLKKKLLDENIPPLREPHVLELHASLVAFSILTSSSISQHKWLWYSFKTPRRIGDFDTIDQASRGAWGNACLPFNLKGLLHIAIFGAVLTILTLAFDVFTQ
ncbi:uncharacterized protein N7498_000535 [Penicillium cinerascens]|uniref:Uncharacterized protein n=1 Tax=Penicillium cinerascens TaxID=70096 RepID=A0A9W9TDD9_9EURO|nr:uncharacterized protein N7498_000535 [Penicillium cinerascens]KAJ5218436.1 hypothetical protein N7498_000535 [Penicillium cinerascens]